MNESVRQVVEHQLKRVKQSGESVYENAKYLKQELERNEVEMAQIVKEKHELEEFLNKN